MPKQLRAGISLAALSCVLITSAKSFILNPFLGLGVAVTSSTLTAKAEQRDSDSFDSWAKQITVRIEGATQGSGVLIERNGDTYKVLTAWHVISSNKENEEITISTFDFSMHASSIDRAERIGNSDLALIEFTSKRKYKIPTIRLNKLKSRQLVRVYGFPLNNSQNLSGSAGLVVASADVGIDNGYQLLYTSSTKPGISGGPVLDEQGYLVGIHGRGERRLIGDSQQKTWPKTNINQGMPIALYDRHRSGTEEPVQADGDTWDDYFALYISVNLSNQANFNRGNKSLDFLPTKIRFVDQMIEKRPNDILSHIMKADLYSEYKKTAEVQLLLAKIEKLYSEYSRFNDLGKSHFAKAADKAEAAKSLSYFNRAYEYVSIIGLDSYIWRSRLYGMLDKPLMAIRIADKGIALGLSQLKDNQPLVFFKPGNQAPVKARSNPHVLDAWVMAKLYASKGAQLNVLKRYEESVAAYEQAKKWINRDKSGIMFDKDQRFITKAQILKGLAVAIALNTKKPGKACTYYREAISLDKSTQAKLWDEICQSSTNQAGLFDSYIKCKPYPIKDNDPKTLEYHAMCFKDYEETMADLGVPIDGKDNLRNTMSFLERYKFRFLEAEATVYESLTRIVYDCDTGKFKQRVEESRTYRSSRLIERTGKEPWKLPGNVPEVYSEFAMDSCPPKDGVKRIGSNFIPLNSLERDGPVVRSIIYSMDGTSVPFEINCLRGTFKSGTTTQTIGKRSRLERFRKLLCSK